MKNRLFAAVLAAALLLSLAACGAAPEETSPAVPPSDSPAPSSAPPVTPTAEPSRVFTDWSYLTDYVPPENQYTRLQEGPMDTLTPAPDYGMLLPFMGEILYSPGDYTWQVGRKYGLTTADGCLVLDPVCSNIYPLSVYDQASGQSEFLDIYVLEKTIYDPEHSADSWSQGYEKRYALAALDGSWVTDFEFSAVYAMQSGILCIRDNQKNLAVGYDEAGNLLFDTADWPIREQLTEYSLYAMTQYDGGYVSLPLAAGGCVFVDASGNVLELEDGAVFQVSGGFVDGLAAVYTLANTAGYVDTHGHWAVEPVYQVCSSFLAGRAVVQDTDGSWVVIDTQGNRLHSFPNQATVQRDEAGGICYAVYVPGYGTEYYDENFQLITIDGQRAELYTGMGFILRSDEGVTALVDGEELFFPGVYSVVRQGDLFLAYSYDENYYTERSLVMDRSQNVLLEMEGIYLSVVTDRVTGEQYLQGTDNAGAYSLYSMAGELLVTDYSAEMGYSAPVDGLVPCRDAVSAGWKDLDNQWVFRYLMDAGD